jgi:putative ATP-dependent endonuclease of OLD family
MYLNRAKVENFRGFHRINIAFEPTTVLIGENNYGKTSLLDILQICLGYRAESGGFPFRARDFRRPDGRENESPPPIKVSLTFREGGVRERSPWRRSKLRKVFTDGPRRSFQLVLKVTAELEPKNGRIDVGWSFVDRSGEPIGPADDGKLLTELRRLAPFLLLGSEKSWGSDEPIEETPPAPAAKGKGSARRRLEVEIERVYRALTRSRAPIPREDLQRGVDAVERLVEQAASRFAPQLPNPRRLLDQVVQAPVPFAVGAQAAVPVHGAGMQSIGKLLLVGGFLEARGSTVLAPSARPVFGIEEPEAHLHPQALAAVWAVVNDFRAQKIVTTNSSELLAAVPLRSVRRLMRRRGSIEVFRPGNKLTIDEMRRIGYHIRVRRGAVMFARCWLLIEGETEFWLLPELARLLGYEFPSEGIRCVEFAQAGIEPLVKLANDMGIEWHLLSDGDKAGRYYAERAREHLRRDKESDRITVLDEPDIEQCLWHHGYEEVYGELAGLGPRPQRPKRKRHWPASVIERAMHRRSKPAVALAVVDAAGRPDSPGVPPVLQRVIETVVRLARSCGR